MFILGKLLLQTLLVFRESAQPGRPNRAGAPSGVGGAHLSQKERLRRPRHSTKIWLSTKIKISSKRSILTHSTFRNIWTEYIRGMKTNFRKNLTFLIQYERRPRKTSPGKI